MKKLLMILLCLCMLIPCVMSEQSYEDQVYTDEQGNWIRIYYDQDLQTWCQFTRYAQPNEEGCFVHERKQQDGTMLDLDWVKIVDGEEIQYRDFWYENGVLTTVITYCENGNVHLESYEPSGLMLHYEISYAQHNEEGYKVSKRFLPDGTIDHEWWWGPDDLYHEIWYEGGEVDSYTYWWYNVDGHDVKYEEHCAEYSKYRYYDYDANGEMVMAENETVLH